MPDFASRADMLSAIRSLHLKRSQVPALFNCSRGIADKLMARPDFPRPFDVTGDGSNLRYVVDEVLAYRDSHRREIRRLAAPALLPRPKILPSPTAEAAVRAGLAALRGGPKKGDPTDFR